MEIDSVPYNDMSVVVAIPSCTGTGGHIIKVSF